MTPNHDAAFTILALDGGGMRGLYAVSALSTLTSRFAAQRKVADLDVGKGFDLIVGTSTGWILAAGLASGLPLGRLRALYKTYGPRIFANPVPTNRFQLYCWLFRHRKHSGNSNEPLRKALQSAFGDETIGQLYKRRGLGLCLPATSLLSHTPRVFKTHHLESRDRDDNLSIVDACLATSAAPIYLPIVSATPDQLADGQYVDGGLWANSPMLVGLLDGLAVSAPKQPITILSVGTCPPVSGTPPTANPDVGVLHWLNRILILNLGMNAQAVAARNMANLLCRQLGRLGKEVRIIRCYESSPAADHSPLLQLDSATAEAFALMESMGNDDGHRTYSWCQPPVTEEGELLRAVFARMPKLEFHEHKGER